MSVFLDTSALIRYFTDDDIKKADLVESLLVKEDRIVIPEAVFPELEYVLSKQYFYSREKLLKVYLFLINVDTISTTSTTKIAVAIYKSHNLDMADCLIAAHSFKGKLASFDENLLKVENITPYW